MEIRVHLSGQDEADYRQLMEQERRSASNLAGIIMADVIGQLHGKSARQWAFVAPEQDTWEDDGGFVPSEDPEESPF